MKDFSAVLKCLGAEIWQMETTAGLEAVVSYSVCKSFFLIHEDLCIADRWLPSGNIRREFFPQVLRESLLDLLNDHQKYFSPSFLVPNSQTVLLCVRWDQRRSCNNTHQRSTPVWSFEVYTLSSDQGSRAAGLSKESSDHVGSLGGKEQRGEDLQWCSFIY